MFDQVHHVYVLALSAGIIAAALLYLFWMATEPWESQDLRSAAAPVLTPGRPEYTPPRPPGAHRLSGRGAAPAATGPRI